MGVLNWILLVLLILAFVWGFIRGYKSSMGKIIFIVSILVGVYAGIPIGISVMNSSFGQVTLTNFYASKLPTSEIFNKSLVGMELVDKNNLIYQGFSEIHFNKFFAGFFVSKCVLLNDTVKMAIASSFSYYTIVGGFFLLFVLIPVIVLNIIYSLLKKVSPFGEDGKNMLGRIAGGIKMIIYASLIYYGLMFVVVLIDQIMVKNGGYVINNFLIKDLRLDDGSAFSLAKLFYNYSVSLLNWISLR